MKILAVFPLLLLFVSPSFAQWLDNSNQFNDSLHMPVSMATSDQSNSITVKSEDGGYFIVWLDVRSSATNKTDIYAQKFDKDGKRLWAVDGVPVAASELNEQFMTGSSLDYRRYSIAAPDGAGGIYVCWNYLTSLGSYSYYGVAVQHLHSDGSRVFGDGGTVVAAPSETSSLQCRDPQLVSDSKGGFFIAWIRSLQGNSEVDLFAYCYKDEGGVLKTYGGGQMDHYEKELTTGAACGTQYYVSDAYDATVQNFMLYPDQQGGCNIVMTLDINGDGSYVGYNRLARVQKDCHTTVIRRTNGDDPGSTSTFEKDYKKDSVVRVYNFKTYSYIDKCYSASTPQEEYTVLNTKIENNGLGFLPLFLNSKYSVNLPQGVILPTGGNINAEFISTLERDYDATGTLGDYHIHGYYRLNEIYDSIPYELCSDSTHPYVAYRPTLPDDALPTDTLLAGPDSLISYPIISKDNYTMAGSGNKVWVTTRGGKLNDPVDVYLQELKLVSAGTKKYTFVINTDDKKGKKIGQETPDGYSGQQVTYKTPSIATDNNGHALFYVAEASWMARVSPIEDGGVLSWGVMGKPTGIGYFGGKPISAVNPMAVLSDDGKGLLAWESNRQNETSSDKNIWMDRITDVFTANYVPAEHTLSALNKETTQSRPTYLTGNSNVWTTINGLVYSSAAGSYTTTTPLVSIMDNYALGFVVVKTFENSGAVRATNGSFYLDRNFTITVDNNPGGSGSIPMRFYITQAEFDALKAADPSISTPGDLGIIEQPNTTGVLAATYTIVDGENTLPITGWSALDGGYYIEFVAKGFSNFFIAKGVVPLPLKWLDVAGTLTASTSAAITWTVTEEKNVKGYTVEYSADGVNFTSGCTTGSGNSGSTVSYSCTVALPAAGTYSFRVKQEDIDGKYSYSKIVVLTSTVSAAFSVSPNPVSSAAVLRIPGDAVVKKLVLLSTSGKAVWQTAGALSGAVSIPMSQLPSGVYHLQVVQDKEVRLLKIVKK